ncbi:hypothetical protein SAMN04487783_1564 [Agrococcus baldri]|uniref:Uracil DNA glycosylase superfamily protein n=1 Tax=Agrococcus baldri TaxID=153730 RepID=A0AA94HMY5_9MICO|nr:hypothetical protein [Agrococcus baldri]SFS11387.1 hypothetical protein SAMN04487783_1564 [Agrococcus baldri]
MDLLQSLDAYRHEASWAVWKTDDAGDVVGDPEFPLEAATEAAHGRAMIVALNPGGIPSAEHPVTPDWSNFHSPNSRHNDIFLAHAFVGTPFWGAYMTDLHPQLVEPNSTLVRPEQEEALRSVQSLIAQARLLQSVGTIICLGGKSLRSISAYADLIERETGIRSIVGVPHYSRSNANVHKHDAERYRRLVHEALGLVTEEVESGPESSGKTRSTK